MRFSHAFHTPELGFPALFCNYGGVRCSTIPKNGRKMKSCDIYGVRNVPKRSEPCDHGKKNTSKAPLFKHFDDPAPPIGNRDQEPRKHHHPDRNDSYPDIEGYIAKTAARKQKAPRQCPGLYDVVPHCRLFPEK